MEKKLDLRVQKTFRALVKAFEELTSEKAFDRMTVNELCIRADIRRPTFYKHFLDKYDFLNFFIKRKLEDIFNDVVDDMGKDASAVDFFTKLFEFLLEDSNKNYQILLSNTLDNNMINELGSIKAFGTELIREKLRYKPKHGVEFDYIVFSVLSLTLSSYFFWLDHQETVSKSDMINLFKTRVQELL